MEYSVHKHDAIASGQSFHSKLAMSSNSHINNGTFWKY